MVYVWIKESAGSLRYVDDIYIAPCDKCGKRISECPKHDKENENGKDGIIARGDDSASNDNNN